MTKDSKRFCLIPCHIRAKKWETHALPRKKLHIAFEFGGIDANDLIHSFHKAKELKDLDIPKLKVGRARFGATQRIRTDFEPKATQKACRWQDFGNLLGAKVGLAMGAWFLG